MLKTSAIMACVLLASACAKAPENIPAANIGSGAYANYSCAQLQTDKMRVSQELENASAAQRSAQSGDAWGVFLLGLPLSSMSGNDKEAAIAIAKGQLQEIDRMLVARNCQTYRAFN